MSEQRSKKGRDVVINVRKGGKAPRLGRVKGRPGGPCYPEPRRELTRVERARIMIENGAAESPGALEGLSELLLAELSRSA